MKLYVEGESLGETIGEVMPKLILLVGQGRALRMYDRINMGAVDVIHFEADGKVYCMERKGEK